MGNRHRIMIGQHRCEASSRHSEKDWYAIRAHPYLKLKVRKGWFVMVTGLEEIPSRDEVSNKDIVFTLAEDWTANEDVKR